VVRVAARIDPDPAVLVAARVAARTSPDPPAVAKRVVGPTPGGRVGREAIADFPASGKGDRVAHLTRSRRRPAGRRDRYLEMLEDECPGREPGASVRGRACYRVLSG
jgi:hypothetical protein